MADPYVSTTILARLLGWNPKTLRNAYEDAEKRHNMASAPGKGDEALLSAVGTPGGHLRWTTTNAARVLRVYGAPVPAEWMGNTAAPVAEAPAAPVVVVAVAEDLRAAIVGGGRPAAEQTKGAA